MHHPQSLDPLSTVALGSGLRAASADDRGSSLSTDDSAPSDSSRTEYGASPRVTDPYGVRRATLLSTVPELHAEDEPTEHGAPAFRVVDVPTFFFYPFDHVAHQVAAEVHGLGVMRRVAVHATGAPCGVTARALVLSTSHVGAHAIAEVLAERETCFSDLEHLIVAIDAALDWLGLDVRPPVELTLDIDFDRDGEVDPNDVTLTVRVSRARYGLGVVAEVLLYHELTGEALVLGTRFGDEKDLPVYPAPRRLPPPSEPVLPALGAEPEPPAGESPVA